MSTTTWAVQMQGSLDAEDKLGAKRLIRVRNREIDALNLVLAAQTPPGTPIPLLAFGTNAEIKASVESIMAGLNVPQWWGSYIAQARESTARLTEDERKTLLAAVNQRLDNGDAVAAILLDISS